VDRPRAIAGDDERTPDSSRIRATATPVAPAPSITASISAIRRPVSRHGFLSAASTTIAVPCWSSWKTGMSRSSFSRRSISKQRGEEMSSRLMPPKLGATRLIGGDDLVGRESRDRPERRGRRRTP